MLKPIRTRPLVDPNLSKHSFSENNSIGSDIEDPDELLESLLRITTNGMEDLRNSLKEVMGDSVPEHIQQPQIPKRQQPIRVPKNTSTDHKKQSENNEPSRNLDSLITTATYNPIVKPSSKTSFNIRQGRQRSLSKQKK